MLIMKGTEMRVKGNFVPRVFLKGFQVRLLESSRQVLLERKCQLAIKAHVCHPKASLGYTVRLVSNNNKIKL